VLAQFNYDLGEGRGQNYIIGIRCLTAGSFACYYRSANIMPGNEIRYDPGGGLNWSETANGYDLGFFIVGIERSFRTEYTPKTPAGFKLDMRFGVNALQVLWNQRAPIVLTGWRPDAPETDTWTLDPTETDTWTLDPAESDSWTRGGE